MRIGCKISVLSNGKWQMANLIAIPKWIKSRHWFTTVCLLWCCRASGRFWLSRYWHGDLSLPDYKEPGAFYGLNQWITISRAAKSKVVTVYFWSEQLLSLGFAEQIWTWRPTSHPSGPATCRSESACRIWPGKNNQSLYPMVFICEHIENLNSIFRRTYEPPVHIKVTWTRSWSANTRKRSYASRHETLGPCWFNVGPPSATLAQHLSNIRWTSRICLMENRFTINNTRLVRPYLYH